jgi:hypothetical protein
MKRRLFRLFMSKSCSLPAEEKEANISAAQQTLMNLEKIIELDTGNTAEELRSTPLDEFRARVELARGHALRFVSKFPFLGRGNVMRDKTIDHATVNRQLDEVLRE